MDHPDHLGDLFLLVLRDLHQGQLRACCFSKSWASRSTFASNLIFFGGTVGAIGAIFVMAFVEQRGPIWIAIAPLVGVPLALLIGSGLILDGPWFIPAIILGSIMIGDRAMPR